MTEALALRKEIVVSRPPEEAFRIFTQEIASWWPLATHSLSGERARFVAMEGRVGGRIYETDETGVDHVWGNITRWNPPHQVAFTWQVGRKDSRESVEMRFAPDGSRTRVTLVHEGWDDRQDEERFRSYDSGWDYVFGECFGKAA